jgi:hemoglobin
MLSDAGARTLAGYWQDEYDEHAPSTVLASSGAISTDTITSLARDLHLLELAGGDEQPTVAQAQLRALLDYVRDCGPRGRVEGWADLPHEDPWGPAADRTDRTGGAPSAGSLYEQIGGAPAMAQVIEAFSRRLLSDRALAPHFEGVDVQRVKRHQRALLDAVTGGPDAYAGRPLRRVHRGLRITHQQYDRAVDHLAASIAGVGADRRVVGAVAGIVDGLRDEIVGH